MCVFLVSVIRSPNLKISTLMMGLMLLYDVFWVFYSQQMFGSNVMVEAATVQPANPAALLAQQLSLPAWFPETLQLPNKIMIPYWNRFGDRDFMMLGLGDIALPALLFAFVLKFDGRRGRGVLQGNFAAVVLGYVVALCLTEIALFWFRIAQPALLYIGPLTLISTVLMGAVRGELCELWALNDVTKTQDDVV
eukprot:TRINITY_DN1155_c0_g1_i1.p1 TRINITY_DN1155_c0_g1~~TRINITY_DN1155_c0_g1_i1.p1  ORF type:complete len:193 (-),score=46.77 TRINITY_DN1155_c0_g1_i1:154-732(-)